MADGSINIDTKIDSKGFLRGLDNLQKTGITGLKKNLSGIKNAMLSTFGGGAQGQLDKLTVKYEKQSAAIKKETSQLDNLKNKYNDLMSGETQPKQLINLEKELAKAQKEADSLSVKFDEVRTKIKDTDLGGGTRAPGYESLNSEMSLIGLQMEQAGSKVSALEGNISKIKLNPSTSDEAIKLGQDIELSESKVKRLNNELNSTDEKMKNLGNSKVDIGSPFKDGLKSIAKYALALFSIRTIYTMLSNLGREYLQQNEQLSANLNYMKFALANAFGPVIEFLIGGFMKVLAFIGAIIKLITKVNIFAGSSDKFAKNMAKGAKSAKDIQKATHSTSIDELNIIQEQKNSDTGANSGVAPNMDLGKMVDEMAASENAQAVANIFLWLWDNLRTGAGLLVLGIQGIFWGLVGAFFRITTSYSRII